MAAGCVRTKTPNRKINLPGAVNGSSKSSRSVVALQASTHPVNADTLVLPTYGRSSFVEIAASKLGAFFWNYGIVNWPLSCGSENRGFLRYVNWWIEIWKLTMRESPEESEAGGGELGIHKVELKQHPKAVSASRSGEILWASRAPITLKALLQRSLFHTCKHVRHVGHEDPSDGPNYTPYKAGWSTATRSMSTGTKLSTCTPPAWVMCCR